MDRRPDFDRCHRVGRRRQLQCSRANLLDDAAVLRLHALAQNCFVLGREGGQVVVTVGAPVDHLAMAIHGRINERMVRAAVFGLDVITGLVIRDVAVVTECHAGTHTRNFSGDSPHLAPPHAFDRLASRSYYTSSPMNASPLQAYAPLVLYLLLAMILAG